MVCSTPQSAVQMLIPNISYSKAANAAGLPSVLITNFTFDSVYSYLSINLPSLSSPNPNNDPHNNNSAPLDDTPILEEELQPLVRELHEGYRCADLLLRLPGNIPIPSFGVLPPLPSHLWTVPEINRFHPEVLTSLSRNISDEKLHPQTHFLTGPKPLPRKIIQAPLIVRHPSEDIYTTAGRQRILDVVGVPDHLQTINTKILIVSFGGQIFRRPQSRTPSRSHSPTSASYSHSQQPNVLVTRTASTESTSSTDSSDSTSSSTSLVHVVPPLVTDLHIWVPGAPPASKSPITPTATQLQKPQLEETEVDDDIEHESTFLPDDSWIAIVCGMTASSTDDSEELPRNFFVAPRDVYMPDLTAVADVLLGKLGYGTTAECVDAATPFVFVPRPLFVEEHGLRRLLEEQGTGVELTRTMYEAGDWKEAVSHAWELGREKKKARKELGLRIGADGGRRKEGEQMVHELIEWANAWRNAQ